METDAPVLIVGAGPIGLSAAILLSQHGVGAIVIDRKTGFSTHPRARFMDSCSLELFRQFGIADKVEATGLGPVWTKTVNCFTTFSEAAIAKVPSPEFHSVPRDITPQVPVMTCQDLLEPILYQRALDSDLIDVRLGTELISLTQDEQGCLATVATAGRTESIAASYAIGADGTRSRVREAMGTGMEGELRDTSYRDVLFHADMSDWLDAKGNQGALLWVAHPMGVGMFQPLDGKSRFRAQISGLDPDRDYSDQWFADWIRAAVGTEELDIDILTRLTWRVSARTANSFRNGRFLLAGDAAHIFTPTGGMGMNTAFAGVRNLAWKLAWVIKGFAPETLLDTYEQEWKPQAIWRESVALQNHDYIVDVYRAYLSGGDTDAAIEKFRQYTDYPGVIFGYELDSTLCEKDPAPEPEVVNPVMQYLPVVRSGRRAPHTWVDEGRRESVIDWFRTDYTVIVTNEGKLQEWQGKIAAEPCGQPCQVKLLTQTAGTPYEQESVVIVRPDGIVARHQKTG